jgi:predicted dehydrogenase
MADKVRYGVLSTAQIARNMHIPAARKATNTEIVVISSREKDRAQKWADELGIPRAYGSYDEVLADPEVDAIINPLPNSMHCEWTIKAAEAGKHILCEKPLAVTVAEARRMIDAAKANNVLLMEGFTHQFNPAMEFIRHTIDSGAIGEVKFVRSELTYTLQDWDTDARVKRELAGGSLYDAGCYCVNTVRAVMGAEPISVQAFERVRETHQVDSNFAGLLKFPGDRLGYIATGMESPFRFTCEVIASKGSLATANLFAGDRVSVVVGGEKEVRSFNAIDRFQVQIEHFSECVLTSQLPKLPPEDGMHNVAVLVALKEAARQGKAVALA